MWKLPMVVDTIIFPGCESSHSENVAVLNYTLNLILVLQQHGRDVMQCCYFQLRKQELHFLYAHNFFFNSIT